MSSWQKELRQAVSSISELSGFAFLPSGIPTAEYQTLEQRFRTLVPRYYLGLIDREDANDPIARMAFPALTELQSSPMALRDPIGDLEKQVAPRLTHRYADRALLHVTNLCPMYCRFCFRKNLMNEKEAELYAGEFAPALKYLAEHKEIVELILTGGDPWMLSDAKLASLVRQIAESAPHVRILRFHTRMPVTLPSRVTQELVVALQKEKFEQIYIVTHFNHPNELSSQAREAVALLRQAGFSILNQSVLLQSVNDSVDTLLKLFRGLGAIGVIPYYLHHCDLVSGAEHFRLPLKRGQELWRELRGKLPGYLLPEYILDIPGGVGKIPVGENFLTELGPGRYLLKKDGQEIPYEDPKNS